MENIGIFARSVEQQSKKTIVVENKIISFIMFYDRYVNDKI